MSGMLLLGLAEKISVHLQSRKMPSLEGFALLIPAWQMTAADDTVPLE
jgi:hypothetical protein